MRCTAQHAAVMVVLAGLCQSVSGEHGSTENRVRIHNPGRLLLHQIGPEAGQVFEAAWKQAGCGESSYEAVVLIVLSGDGHLRAFSPPATREVQAVTYQAPAGTVAIFHTHPNRNDPRPSQADRKLAHRLGIPIATMTTSGLFLYHPATRETTELMRGLAWARAKNWGLRRVTKTRLGYPAESARDVIPDATKPEASPGDHQPGSFGKPTWRKRR